MALFGPSLSQKGAKGAPKGAKRKPKGAKREPKGAKRKQKGAKREPEGAKRKPKGAKRLATHPAEQTDKQTDREIPNHDPQIHRSQESNAPRSTPSL